MRKITVVIASRANYGRIKSVLREISIHSKLKLKLIIAASALLEKYGNCYEIIEQDGFKIDHKVYVIIEGENPITMAKSTGLAIVEIATALSETKPDIVLTIADRFETMATAIAASYMNIPLAHTQGGEITGSIDEKVRHAITKLSNYHFVATKKAKIRVIKMGENEEDVFLTGCPALDIVNGLDLSKDNILDHYGGIGASIDLNKTYIVVLQHPVTTEYGSGFQQINKTLQAIRKLHMQTIWFWPNVDAGSDEISKGIRVFREKYKDINKFVHFYKNFSPENYIRLIYNSSCLVGNSSSGIREGAFLGIPVVNIGTRQSGREKGENIIDVNYDTKEIEDAVNKQINLGKYKRSFIYGDGKAGKRIADILSKVELKIDKKLSY